MSQTPYNDCPALPRHLCGPGALSGVADLIGAGARRVLIVADPYWAASGRVTELRRTLSAQGQEVALFSCPAREPTAVGIREAVAEARRHRADTVVGFGGGTALDLAKATAAGAVAPFDITAAALGARELPDHRLRLIQIPTTAGTGSEANGTAVFADDAGRKVWIYGAALLPDGAILDPDLTRSLPEAVAIWCGLDALTHAFEAATSNGGRHAGRVYARTALAEIAAALSGMDRAGAGPEVRLQMLHGAFLAGYAIGLNGTGLAHCLSHALAEHCPLPHGQATTLGFRVSIDWLAAHPTPAAEAAARLLTSEGLSGLARWYDALLRDLDVALTLPDLPHGLTAAALAQAMAAPENQPMLAATPSPPGPDDRVRIAGAALNLAKTPRCHAAH